MRESSKGPARRYSANLTPEARLAKLAAILARAILRQLQERGERRGGGENSPRDK